MGNVVGRLRLWIVLVFLVMVLDMVTPAAWAVCAAHWIVLPLAWRNLHRRFILRLTIAQMVAASVPGLVGISVLTLGESIDASAVQFITPIRGWTLAGLAAAAYFHTYLQGRLRMRLARQRELQHNVRGRSLQVRRVNKALVEEVARRQATQHKLTQSESTFQSLIDRMNLQVARKNVDGVFTYANDAFCKDVGKTPDEVVGHTDEDLFAPAIAASYRADDIQAMVTGKSIDKVEEHPGAGGRSGFAQVFKAAEYDRDGKCIGIQVIFWDITEKHRHAMMVRESEARKRALFDAAGDAVVLIDQFQKIVEANPSAKRLFKVSGGRLVGRPIADLITPELDTAHATILPTDPVDTDESSSGFDLHGPRLPTATASVLTSNQNDNRSDDHQSTGMTTLNWADLPLTRRHHLTLRRDDGSSFDSEVSLHRIPFGNAEGRAVLIRDVTLQRQAFEAMRDAMAVAEQANRMKTQFMAGISHELRTPLGGIQGLTNLLTQQTLPETARRYLDMILYSTQLLSDMIEDILDFAAIEAGRVSIHPAKADLHDIFGDALGCLAVRAANRPIRFSLAIDPSTPRLVWADAKRLRQIVVNLAGNALKFTTEGEIHVRLEPIANMTSEAKSDGADRIENGTSDHPRDQLHLPPETTRRRFAITVRDTGIGIDAENQKRIFDAFEQADRSTNKRFGGTGLGLSIVRGLADRMRGELSVESEVGVGSTFRCELELVVFDKQPTGMANSPSSPGTVVISVGSQSIAESLEETITSLGWQAIEPRSLGEQWRASSNNQGPSLSLQPASRSKPELVPMHWILTDATAETAFANRPRGDRDRVMWLGQAGDARPSHARDDDVTIIEPVLPDEVRRWIAGEAVFRAESGGKVPGWPTRHESTKANGSKHHASLRILVADDSPTNRLVIHDQLVASGHSVQTVADGREAIEEVQRATGPDQRQFDCVLMDLQMPNMDGSEATQVLHKWFRQQKSPLIPPPVIALTAHVTDQHRAMCRQAGMQGYVTKPVQMDVLFAEIERVVPAMATSPSITSGDDATMRRKQPLAEASLTSTTRSSHASEDDFKGLQSDTITHDWKSQLSEHCGHDEASIQSVREAIQIEIPTLMKQLEDAIKSGDSNPLKTAAHTLKSCLRYVAPPQHVATAAEVEALAGDPNVVQKWREDCQQHDRCDWPDPIKRLETTASFWTSQLA
ncbi:MAG: ATP-binding protein [Planctomycetota bacterium]